MNDQIMRVVHDVHSRGNTAEIKKVKEGIIVLEVKKKIVYRSGGQSGVR